MEKAIEINNLEKSYDSFTLKIDKLEIPKGMITGFIGENGSGKTTTIKTILNIVKKYQGDIKLFNTNSLEEKEKLKENIGVVLDESFFPEILTATDVDKIMKSTFKKWDRKLFYEYLEKFKLSSNKQLKTFISYEQKC